MASCSPVGWAKAARAFLMGTAHAPPLPRSCQITTTDSVGKGGVSRNQPQRAGRLCPSYVSASTPHFCSDLLRHAQLRPLLALGKNVALFGRGKAALRGEGQ